MTVKADCIRKIWLQRLLSLPSWWFSFFVPGTAILLLLLLVADRFSLDMIIQSVVVLVVLMIYAIWGSKAYKVLTTYQENGATAPQLQYAIFILEGQWSLLQVLLAIVGGRAIMQLPALLLSTPAIDASAIVLISYAIIVLIGLILASYLINNGVDSNLFEMSRPSSQHSSKSQRLLLVLYFLFASVYAAVSSHSRGRDLGLYIVFWIGIGYGWFFLLNGVLGLYQFVVLAWVGIKGALDSENH